MNDRLEKWLKAATGERSRYVLENKRIEQAVWRFGKGMLYGMLFFVVWWALTISLRLLGIMSVLTDQAPAPGTDLRGYAYLLIALIGLPFVIWRSIVAQAQATTAAQGLITERFTKAVDQLGAEKTVKKDGEETTIPNLEVRLGGIYALERIAQDSLRDHITIMEVLCAYIRENAAKPETFEQDEGRWDILPPLRVDIQAALTVIGRRGTARLAHEAAPPDDKPPYRLDLRNCWLATADLTNALLGPAQMHNTDLPEAVLDGANLAGARLGGANLTGAWMRDANLTGAGLYNANLTRARLNDANLTEADLTKSDLTAALLNNANLSNARLNYCILSEARLIETDLSGAQLIGSKLWYARLIRTKLNSANLSVIKAKFTAVRSADFTDVRGLKKKQLADFFSDTSTILTDGMTRPDHWQEYSDDRTFFNAWHTALTKAGLPIPN